MRDLFFFLLGATTGVVSLVLAVLGVFGQGESLSNTPETPDGDH